MKDVIRISMKSLFTEEEKINLQKQLEMDREEYYTKKGIEQGLSQGEKNKSIEIAKKMILNNISVNQVCKFTGLSKEEVDELLK